LSAISIRQGCKFVWVAVVPQSVN